MMPSLNEFLEAARPENPGVADAELTAYWQKTYPPAVHHNLPSLDVFLEKARPANPDISDSALTDYWHATYGVQGAPEKLRSLPAEIGAQTYAGATIDLPQQFGQALKYFGAHEVGQSIEDWAEKRKAANPELEPQLEGRNLAGRALSMGARALVPSAATMVPAAAVAPLGLPAAAVAGAAGAFGLFGASQAQQTYENVIKAGGSEEDAKNAGLINLLIEGGGETIGNLFGYKLFGVGAKAITKAATPAGQAIANATERQAVKPFLKQLPQTAAVEAGTEFGQNYGEAKVEAAYGVQNTQPVESGLQGASAAFGMTALLAPFGLAGFVRRARANAKIADALQNPDADPVHRAAAAKIVFDEIGGVDPEAAKAWGENAAIAIAHQAPIALDETFAKPAALTPAAPFKAAMTELDQATTVDAAIQAAAKAVAAPVAVPEVVPTSGTTAPNFGMPETGMPVPELGTPERTAVDQQTLAALEAKLAPQTAIAQALAAAQLKQETENAGTVRGHQAVLPQSGEGPQNGGEAGGGNLQRPPAAGLNPNGPELRAAGADQQPNEVTGGWEGPRGEYIETEHVPSMMERAKELLLNDRRWHATPVGQERRAAVPAVIQSNRSPTTTILGKAPADLADSTLKVAAVKADTPAQRKIAQEELDRRAVHAVELRRMAGESGWAERGGHIIRATEDFSSPDYNKVVGRTVWVPRAEWYQRMRQEMKSLGLSDAYAIDRAVERHLKGEPLNPKEQRTVNWMLNEAQAAIQDTPEPAAWATMTEGEKNAELDAIFGEDTRPAAAGAPVAAAEMGFDLKGQTEAEARAEALSQARAAEAQRTRDAAPPAAEFTLAGSERPTDQARARGQQELTPLPERTLDTMSEAIALSSPSGRMSKSAKAKANARLGTALFGENGLQQEPVQQPSERERLLRQAAELRELAARGMNTQAYTREAERLENLAAQNVGTAQQMPTNRPYRDTPSKELQRLARTAEGETLTAVEDELNTRAEEHAKARDARLAAARVAKKETVAAQPATPAKRMETPGMKEAVDEAEAALKAAGVKFSRNATAGEYVSLRAAAAVVERIKKAYHNLAEVVLLGNPAQVPDAALKEVIQRAGAMADAEGAFHNGKIYLFHENIADEARLEHVLVTHELRHYGLRGMLGAELDHVLHTLWKSNPALKQKAVEVKRRFNLDSNLEATEEALVDIPESELVKLTGWDKLKMLVRDWLQKHGFEQLAAKIKVSGDQEISRLLDAAREWVRNGKVGVSTDLYTTRLQNVAPGPLWYSELVNQIGQHKTETAPAAIWKGILTNLKGVKKDEIEWSGINNWLDLQEGKVTKQQIADYLNENGVRVEETELGSSKSDAAYKDATAKAARLNEESNRFWREKVDPVIPPIRGVDRANLPWWAAEMVYPQSSQQSRDEAEAKARKAGLNDAQIALLKEYGQVRHLYVEAANEAQLLKNDMEEEGQAKFATYTLPGGENYRELLLTLPALPGVYGELPAGYRVVTTIDGARVESTDTGNIIATGWNSDAAVDVARRKLGEQPAFSSSHFDQPNILAHIRFNERTDAEGKRVLFIEEIQSDWAQRGKRDGFATQQSMELQGRLDKIRQRLNEIRNQPAERVGQEERDLWTEEATIEKQVKSVIPSAPFVGKTESWVALALKRMIRYAAENGFDRVAWTTGEQQADRYDLSKSIDEVIAQRAKDGSYMIRALKDGHDLIAKTGIDAKDLPEVVGKSLADKIINDPRIDISTSYKGLDLKVGGEGMRAFYDKIVPNVANDVLKKLGGGRVSTIDMTEVLKPEQEREPHNQPGFDITPTLKERALGGMPLFSRAVAGSKTTGDLKDSIAAQAADFVRDYFTGFDQLSWWQKTIGTPFHLAMTNAEFRPFFDENQALINDVSRYANESADLAQDLLPRVEKFKDVAPAWLGGKASAPSSDIAAVSKALYAGTLWGGGSPMNGRIWRDEELRTGRAKDGEVSLPAFAPMSVKQIALYREALSAAQKTMDELAKSLIHRIIRPLELGFDRTQSLARVAEDVGLAIDSAVIDAQADAARVAQLVDAKKAVADIAQKAADLNAHGYFPAMRFGKYALHVTRDGKQLYFALFESKLQAWQAKRQLAQEFPGATISKFVIPKEKYKLFQGLSLDALEVFADYIVDSDGNKVAKDALVQGFLKAATAERSVMNRHIHRKGLPGYSDDIPRVLASFVVSGARSTASNYHAAELLRLAAAIKAGDVSDYATNIARYLIDPAEEAHGLRGFLFAQYLGGSIASGLVNITQPFMVTAPWLAQHTAYADAVKKLCAAAAERNPEFMPGGIGAAYRRAKKEGIVTPQEIHQLRAETGGGVSGRNLALRKLSFAWGSIFSLAEQFNRKTTFLAAYRVAEELKLTDPYGFAKNAVAETQFLYNKGNRPVLSRGPIGATVMTFKQFTISYLEMAKRLYDTDKTAFALLAVTLLAAAGIEGLPFAEDIEDLVDTLGQWMGFATNSKKRLRQWTTSILGPELSQIALRGVSGLAWMPVDIAGRLGMANLIPGTAALKPSEKNKTRDVIEILGPAGQFLPVEGTMLGNALERLGQGDLFGALKAGAPKAVQAAARGGEMLSSGQAKDLRGRKIAEVTPGESVLQMTGLQPAGVARESQKIGIVQQDIDLQRRMESEIAEQWARGVVDGDRADVQAARKKLEDWNANNPELRIRINSQQIIRRIQEIRRPRMERFVKSAPPEIRSGVREALR